MPSDELGAGGTIERLVLMEKEFIVSKTTGGDEFLDCEDPDARALVPLATTVAAVLSELRRRAWDSALLLQGCRARRR